MASIGILTLELSLPGCGSLKEKRGRLKPLITKLQKGSNLSVAEVGHQDVWQSASLACALVGSDAVQVRRRLQKTADWVIHQWPDVEVNNDYIEMI